VRDSEDGIVNVCGGGVRAGAMTLGTLEVRMLKRFRLGGLVYSAS